MSLTLDPDDQEFRLAMEVRRRPVSRRADAHVRRVHGGDLQRVRNGHEHAATERTPERYVHALFDSTEGYEGDPKLLTAFETECQGEPDCLVNQIIEGPIPFFALCEHHALPFHGHAYVGYIPCEHIIGISKLTRLVRLYAKRFTVQERIGQQITDTLVEMLQPHGAAVYLAAHHLCTQMHGVRASVPLTRTTLWHGEYSTNDALRGEFLAACGVRE